jgi:peptidyl-prolyl cis-trans isomerase C
MLSTIRTSAAFLAASLLFAPMGARAQDAGQPAAEPQAAEQPAAQAPAAGEAPAAAQPEPPPNPADVVAKVGDETVTEAEVAVARDAFGSELGQVPPEQQHRVLVDAMVNIKLLAKAGRDAGVDKTPQFAERLKFLELQALRDTYVNETIVPAATPEALQKAYQDLVVKEFKPEEQVRARHILVDTKEAAEKIIADLKGGAKFEDLAKQSKDPSGENGGDLGFFGKGQMVPPFEQAAFALEPGKITETPVQSEFGWHVIKVEEKRMSEPPPFAEVEEQLKQYVLRQKFDQLMTELRAKYPVEIVGEEAEAAPAGEAGSAGDAAAPATAPAEQPAEPAAGEQPATGEQPAN